MTPGDIIKRARTTKGLSQRQLATLSGVTPSFVTKIEAGDTLPGYERCMALARALGLEIEELWSLVEHERLKAFQARQHTRGMMRSTIPPHVTQEKPKDVSVSIEIGVEELRREIEDNPRLDSELKSYLISALDMYDDPVAVQAVKAMAQVVHHKKQAEEEGGIN
jgi:transcriptional regulator with XRE-family HTH domain